MSGELESPAIEGKPITGGIAQTVTRENGVVRIELQRVPGQPMAHASYGPAMSIPLPEPVTVKAGEVVVVEMGWLPEPERQDTSAPMYMRKAATIRSVVTGPSAVTPGHAMAALAEASEPDLMPDLFLSRSGLR